MSRSKIDTCKTNSMELTFNFIGSKWNSLIIYYLGKRTMRFGELRKMIPEITHKVLTQKLKELADYGIVNRKIYSEIPPKVEYSLTEDGTSLIPIIMTACDWGKQYKLKRYSRLKPMCDVIKEKA